MKTNIKFNLQVIRHETSGLSLTVLANGQEIYTNPDVESDCSIETEIHLPARFDFDITGKQPEDTCVAADGTITADKAFVLNSIEFDRIRIESYNLPNSHVFLKTDTDEHIAGNWWAHNGRASIIIDRDDPVIWMLDHPEILEMLPEKG